MGKYPEHEKLQEHRRESLTLSAFYDWLEANGYHIARFHEHTDGCYEQRDGFCGLRDTLMCGLSPESLYTHAVPNAEGLIGAYLAIDPKKLSAEKDAMYEELRASARAKPATTEG